MQENVEIARRIVELANARDIVGLVGLVAPDIEGFPADDHPEATGFRGAEAFARYNETWLESFESYEVQVSEYLARGDYVIVVGRVVGRGRSSGVEVADDDAWLWRFRDGKAIEYRECRTKAAALEAAGLSE